jgi:hypothetical protein
MSLLQRVSEGLARKTSRRGFFGRGAGIATGALMGAAAGSLSEAGSAIAGHGNNPTVCHFPGPACPCDGCSSGGTCAKPCIIMTVYYASGCWVDFNSRLGVNVTCCDCDCNGKLNYPGQQQIPADICGCGSDQHNDPAFCP